MKGIEKALTLAEELQHVFVGTSDREGTPHIAAAAGLDLTDDANLQVSSWFYPATVSNLQKNRKVSVVVWNPATDEGFQILETVQRIEETAFLDGYAPELEAGEPPPQVERRLVASVEKSLPFLTLPIRTKRIKYDECF